MKISTKTITLSLVIMTVLLCLFGCGQGSRAESYQSVAVSTNNAENDITVKFKDIKAKADKGDIESQCWLAICYDYGLYGCRIDKPQAQDLYQKVANHSNENLASVQHSKGMCYMNGYGVERNLTTAVQWFRKATDQKFTPAQFMLGGLVSQSDEEMVKWNRFVADQGFALSQGFLGAFYLEDNKYEEAVKWIRLAADQGLADARFGLGQCYWNGWGVPPSKEESVKWLRLAADQGFFDAQISLGLGYSEGRDIPQNKLEALKYFYLALQHIYLALQQSFATQKDINLVLQGDDCKMFEEITAKMNRLFAELGENDISEFLLKWVPYHSGEKDFFAKIFCGGYMLSDANFLKLAVLNNQTAVIKELVKSGANVNGKVVRLHHSEISNGCVNRYFRGREVNKANIAEGAFVELLFIAAVDKNVNAETIKCLLDLGAISDTSITIEYRKQTDTRRVITGEQRIGTWDNYTLELDTEDVPVYKDHKKTFHLLNVASSPEKKSLLEAAMKKWEKK